MYVYPFRRSSKLQEKTPALEKEHPAFQHNIVFSLFSFFVPVIYALLDPDPDLLSFPNTDPDPADQNQCGTGSKILFFLFGPYILILTLMYKNVVSPLLLGGDW